jgi:hypothetical protein
MPVLIQNCAIKQRYIHTALRWYKRVQSNKSISILHCRHKHLHRVYQRKCQTTGKGKMGVDGNKKISLG